MRAFSSQLARRTQPQGMILPITLALLFILLGLAAMLMLQGQQLHLLVLGERFRFEDLLSAQEVEASTGLLLDEQQGSSQKTLHDSKGRATVRLGSRDSALLHRPASGYATFENVLPGAAKEPWGMGEPESSDIVKLPAASYVTPESVRNVPVPAEHSFVRVDADGWQEDLLYSDLFPYAAYAPSGSLKLNQAVSWINHTYDSKASDRVTLPQYPPPAAVSALPVKLWSRDVLSVEDFPYGSAWSQNGPIEFGTGAAVGRTGPLGTGHTYGALLERQVEKAFTALIPIASGVDKTPLIAGRLLSGEAVLKLFKGELNFATFFSVEQAMTFPFPIFPKWDNKAIVDVLVLHVPLPVDFTDSKFADAGPKIEELEKRIQFLDKEYTRRKPELTRKNSEVEQLDLDLAKKVARFERGEIPESDVADARAKLAVAMLARDKLQEELNGYLAEKEQCRQAQKTVTKQADDLKKDIKNFDVRLLGKPPQTSKEESLMHTFGWAYFRLAGRLESLVAGIIGDIIDGHADRIVDDITSKVLYPVRLVHFSGDTPDLWAAGRQDYESDQIHRQRPADIPLDFTSFRCTWTVPAGRSVTLKGNYEFRGDLWLRRGSLMYVEGDLRLTDPKVWTPFDDREPLENLKPSGRLVIEEGATLVVSGNLRVQGTRNEGSVVLLSQYGPPRMITSAVLCKGNLETDWGVHTGVLMDDMFNAVADATGAPANLKKYQGWLRTLKSVCAPHLGKVLFFSAWSKRTCYFADYATTFEFVPWLVEAGLGGPWPIPLPYGNCLKTPHKILSYVYAAELGMMLGENTFTHSSLLWPWGKGCVPIIAKADPKLVSDIANGIDMSAIQDIAFERGILKDALTKVLPDFVTWGVKTLVVQQLKALLNPLGGCGGDKAGKDADSWTSKLKQAWKGFTIVKKIYKQLNSIRTGMSKRISEMVLAELTRGSAAQMKLREITGIFLYSGGSMRIGQASGPSALMASGFFVAKQDLRVAAEFMVGSLISLHGDITAKRLYHFPYFSRASLYQPKRFENVIFEAVQCELPRGEGAPLDVGRGVFHVTGRGWERDR
jgi:hypothetical protein